MSRKAHKEPIENESTLRYVIENGSLGKYEANMDKDGGTSVESICVLVHNYLYICNCMMPWLCWQSVLVYDDTWSIYSHTLSPWTFILACYHTFLLDYHYS